MLRRILQSLGMTVDTVDSGEAALEYLREHRPDVIFMDHTMPGMDGLTALRQIQSNPATATIPVAMYTSKDEPAYRDQAHAAGAVDVLSKPATLEALGRILERMSTLLDPNVRADAEVLAAADAAVTVEWVERLVAERTERLFYDAVESQVLPLLNDVVAKLRRELQQVQEDLSSRLSAQAAAPVADNLPDTAAWQAQQATWLEARLSAFQQEAQTTITPLIHTIATQVCQTQLHEFTDQLVKPISARFADELNKASSTIHQAAVEAACEAARGAAREAAAEIRDDVGSGSGSGSTEDPLTPEVVLEAAREAARETARDIAAQALADRSLAEGPNTQEATLTAARSVAQEVATQALAQARPATGDLGVMREAWEADIKSLQRRMYITAFWAAVAGAGAALVLFYFLSR